MEATAQVNSIDHGLLRQFIALSMELRETEATAADLKERVAGLKEQLIDQFVNSGTDRITVDGMTVYTSVTTWASIPDPNKEAAYRFMARNPELRDLVKKTVNSQQLSAYVREMNRLNQPLSKRFAELIKITDKPDVRVIRGR